MDLSCFSSLSPAFKITREEKENGIGRCAVIPMTLQPPLNVSTIDLLSFRQLSLGYGFAIDGNGLKYVV